jgi:hypothetical protein
VRQNRTRRLRRVSADAFPFCRAKPIFSLIFPEHNYT